MVSTQLPERIASAKLPPHSDNKNVVSQINRYNRWLAESGAALHQPDLSSYRDLLLETLVENTQHREALVSYLQQEYPSESFATIKAMADELELRLMRAIDPQHSRVTTVSVQDEADSRHIRLTSTQGAALMLQPDVSRLRGRRDVAIIALLLATGLREGEVVQLEIDDLYQSYGSVPALRVISGKGAKARMVPFGDMLWARQIAELWLGGREAGPIFTRMRQGRGDMRSQEATAMPMTTRSIQRMLRRYPIQAWGCTVQAGVCGRKGWRFPHRRGGVPLSSLSSSAVPGLREDATLAIQPWRLFTDDAIAVCIAHVRIGWMLPVDRRNPVLSRFGARNAAVAISIPLSPITAGLLIRIARRLLLRLLARGRLLTRASCARENHAH